MAQANGDTVQITASVEQDGTTAVVKAWLKNDGDRVDEDEPVLELETDKVVVEVPAPCAGTLEIVASDESDVRPGGVLGYVHADEVVADADKLSAADTTVADEPAESASARVTESFDSELRLSPSVRRLLRKHDLDPERLTGTGRRGRITREDVLAATEQQHDESTTAEETDAAALPPAKSTDAKLPAKGATTLADERDNNSERIPHDRMRRQIAEHMLQSVTRAPHVTAVFEADFSAIMAHRRAHQAEYAAQGVKLTLTAYFVAACVRAMQAAPRVNSRWHDDFLEVFHGINIGIGTAVGDSGLVVPVIERAQQLSLMGIAARLQDLTERARNSRLERSDVQGGTFTISNHGTSGSLLATPVIINQPQSAILGIGAVEKRVVVREVDGVDAIQIRPCAYVSLSIDHRVVDGARTNAWLSRFVETINRWPG